MTAPAKLPAPSVDPAAAHLAAKYGPDFRAVLGLVDHPFAERDEGSFWQHFGDLRGDPASDLTAHRQSVAGMVSL